MIKLPRVRRLLLVPALLLLAPAAGAWAAQPSVSAQASPTRGGAPLTVTLQASGDAASWRWNFGDGSAADGASASHAYAAGSWTATLTGTSADGETATAEIAVVAEGIAATAPAAGRFGRPAVFAGAVVPAAGGMPVALYSGSAELAVGRTGADGSFRLRVRRLRSPGPYVVRTAAASSQPLTIALHPLLSTHFVGPGTVGAPLALRAAVHPAAAGRLRIRLWRGGRVIADVARGAAATLRVGTARAGPVRAEVELVPAAGYLGARHVLARTVVVQQLTLGATGPSVAALEQRLVAMHYALARVDSRFGEDDYEAVLAFQKVHRLARTGRVDPGLWRRIFASAAPRARYPGTHVEVDKARQVLYEVRDGKVVLVVHVSTGATGNTPVGLWHIYRRVPGWDWVLYYPSYFLRGFAIHGYPDVPAYPASHGCVRVPLWIATRLYAMQSYGEAVYVYS